MCAVLDPWVDAMAAGDGVEALFEEVDVVLAEMLAVFAGWVFHGITSKRSVAYIFEKVGI